MILIILAAGRGSRLKTKTRNIPKCLIKIGKNSIIDYIYPFIKKFNKTIIVCGYKSKLIEEKFKNNKKIFFAFNKKYKSTNMVYSLFQAKKFVKTNEDIIVCYSDVIFDYKIYELFKKNRKTFIPIKKNWLILWKKRMSMIKIINDAENLIVKNNKLVSIGGKIKKIFPRYQFMGLMKIVYKDFLTMEKFYRKINNIKIDFTSFLDLIVKNNKLNISCIKTNKFWFEIDTTKDLAVAKQITRRITLQ